MRSTGTAEGLPTWCEDPSSPSSSPAKRMNTRVRGGRAAAKDARQPQDQRGAGGVVVGAVVDRRALAPEMIVVRADHHRLPGERGIGAREHADHVRGAELLARELHVELHARAGGAASQAVERLAVPASSASAPARVTLPESSATGAAVAATAGSASSTMRSA